MTGKEKELLQYLNGFLTEERKDLFEQILNFRTRHFAIGLENIFQPHNANAVIRSCDCFGIQDVHIVAEYNDFLAAKNVSKGALKWTTQHVYDSTSKAIDTLRKEGYQIVATTPHKDDTTIYDFDINKKSVFFFGAEKKGLSDIVLEKADTYLKVPMVGTTESLNVSVCAAIIMQHLGHRLRTSDITWQLSPSERENLILEWTKNSVNRVDILMREFERKNDKKH